MFIAALVVGCILSYVAVGSILSALDMRYDFMQPLGLGSRREDDIEDHCVLTFFWPIVLIVISAVYIGKSHYRLTRRLGRELPSWREEKALKQVNSLPAAKVVSRHD